MKRCILSAMKKSAGMNKKLKITLLADDPHSWIQPFVKNFAKTLKKLGHQVKCITSHVKLARGDIAFFLGCTQIVPKNLLALHNHNLVVHESALPKGKGWSPLTWQILEGKNEIPITLFEATDQIDAGVIYAQNIMHFNGSELVNELREVQGEHTIRLCLEFVKAYPHSKFRRQKGKETFYSKRTPKDSEIDPKKSITQIFNQLRVCDNKKYPAFFILNNQKYVLKIEKG